MSSFKLISGGVFIYKSIDGGNSWQEIRNGLNEHKVSSLAINPLNPNILYAGTKSGIYKSINGGNEWIPLKNWFIDTRVLSIVVDHINPANVYVSTWKGVFKSTTGGNFWFEAKNGLYRPLVTDLIINKINSSVLYAVTAPHRELFRTIDGGNNWDVVFDFEEEFFAYNLTVDPVNPANLYLVFSSGGDENGLLGSILISRDEGKNWFMPYKRMPVTFVYSVVIDPANPNCLYAATTKGVYKSTDQGFNWKETSNGLNDRDITFLAIDPVNSSIIYALANKGFGIYKSIDGGESWRNIGLVNYKIRSLVIDPINSLNIYVAAGETQFKEERNKRLERFKDIKM